MNPPGFLLPAKYREFFHAIDSCEKEVELVTQEGIHLNMKSMLAQYVAFTNVFCSKQIKELELITHSEKDTIRIITGFMNMTYHEKGINHG